MMYYLDTNTVIYFFKGMGKVTEHLLKQSPQKVAIPAIVLYELQVGIQKSTLPTKRMQQLKELAASIKIIPFVDEEAFHAAQLRVQLEVRGLSIGPIDNLIAGTALAHQATLVTHNLEEFKRVKDLKIVDWY